MLSSHLRCLEHLWIVSLALCESLLNNKISFSNNLVMKFVQVLYASKKNGLYHAKDSILVGITEFEKCLVDIGLYFQNWLCRDNKVGCFYTCFHSIDALHTPFANLLADS